MTDGGTGPTGPPAKYLGRGAWSKVGGTLKLSTNKKSTVPGPYYMLAKNENQRIGLKPFLQLTAGQPVDLNELAVYHGVIAIQVLSARYGPVDINGVFTKNTEDAVKVAQGKLALKADGIVGQGTMAKLLLPLIKEKATAIGEPWEPVYGILKNEGALDPGAVGYLDSNDLGLAQINSLSHPDISLSNAFCPSYAVEWVTKYLKGNQDLLGGNLRDAVASYNLGVGGTRLWIKDGRPDLWVPPWDATGRARNVKKYIDTILSAHENL